MQVIRAALLKKVYNSGQCEVRALDGVDLAQLAERQIRIEDGNIV